jgi:bacteriorhodopsin
MQALEQPVQQNEKEEKKVEKIDPKHEAIKDSFYVTYAFLMTTATITFIEAIRTKDMKIRNILNLETCISVVAAFFYGKFVHSLETEKEINYAKINDTRYTDWAITTPIMLLVLVLALLYNNKSGAMKFSSYLLILLLNYGMLGMGYIGELGLLSKTNSNIAGFGFFAAMYGFIYYKYLHKKYNFDNSILFWAFVILWAFYGVVYMMDEVTKNVAYNVLDLLSKCFVGIFFWAYYAKVFTL